MVNNVETLYNVRLAEQGAPVTRKFLSVCGAVREPKSFWAPVGTPFRDLLALAGGATVDRVRSLRERHHDGDADLRSGRGA